MRKAQKKTEKEKERKEKGNTCEDSQKKSFGTETPQTGSRVATFRRATRDCGKERRMWVRNGGYDPPVRPTYQRSGHAWNGISSNMEVKRHTYNKRCCTHDRLARPERESNDRTTGGYVPSGRRSKRKTEENGLSNITANGGYDPPS